MGLSVTVLGCAGSFPGPDDACSGYLVQGGGVTLWVDAGSGTLAHLQRHLTMAQVDAVVLSHDHPDHWSDIELFYVACRWQLDHQGVPLYAPASLRDHTYHEDMGPWLVWHDVADGDRVDVDGLRLSFSRTEHGPETLALRVDGEGRSLGYSADSGPGWSLEALGPGLDLALCEATLSVDEEGTEPGHMSARQAGTAARAAGVDRLVLTHLRPTLDLARSQRDGSEAFGEPVHLAVEHDRYEV